MNARVTTTDKGGGTYASRAGSKTSDLYEDRNVIIVRVRKTSEEVRSQFKDTICELVLQKLNITINDTVGAQYLYDKGDDIVEIWLLPHKSAQAFTSDSTKQLNSEFSIVSVRPALTQETSLMVLGVPINVKDNIISDYVSQFGGKITSPPEMCNTRSGLWKGRKNGDRRYKADFTNQLMAMGTYHLIAGKKVRFVYPGNLRTCARCHQTSEACPGKGFASVCKENNGPQVLISSHINSLKAELHAIRSRQNNKHLPLTGVGVPGFQAFD